MHVLHTRPPGHRRYRVNALAYSPDGEFLLAGIERRRRDAWSADEAGRLLRLELPEGDSPLERRGAGFIGVAWSPDGSRVAGVTGSRLVVLSSAFDTVHVEDVPFAAAVAFGGTPSRLLVALNVFHDGGLVEFDLDRTETASTSRHPSAAWSGPAALRRVSYRGVVALAWNPVAGSLALGGEYRVEVCTDESPPTRLTTAECPGWVQHVALSCDGGYLAAATGARVHVWALDGATLSARPEPDRHRANVTGLAFSADGRYLLSSSLDGTVRVWDPSSGCEVACLDWGIGPLRSLACHPDGTTAAVGGGRRDAIVVFDLP